MRKNYWRCTGRLARHIQLCSISHLVVKLLHWRPSFHEYFRIYRYTKTHTLSLSLSHTHTYILTLTHVHSCTSLRLDHELRCREDKRKEADRDGERERSRERTSTNPYTYALMRTHTHTSHSTNLYVLWRCSLENECDPMWAYCCSISFSVAREKYQQQQQHQQRRIKCMHVYIVCRFHSSSCCARVYVCFRVCVHCIRLFWWSVCVYVFAFYFLRTFVCAIRWIRTNTYTNKSIDFNRMHAHCFMCEMYMHCIHMKEKIG